MEHEILDAKKIIDTIDVLSLRIAERFPDSSLSQVARKLHEVGEETDSIIAWIEKPNAWYRLGTGLFIALLLGGLIYAIFSLQIDFAQFTLADAAQVGEAVINEIVLLGAAVIFLVSIETRAKRRKVVAAVNRLRSIAHVIDAHQLTKDPYVIARQSGNTAHSPQRTMTEYELGRYLDYCSELLSLTGKVGFLYVQKFNDPVSVNAVNELEELTTSLSRKVWQKLMILKAPVVKKQK